MPSNMPLNKAEDKESEDTFERAVRLAEHASHLASRLDALESQQPKMPSNTQPDDKFETAVRLAEHDSHLASRVDTLEAKVALKSPSSGGLSAKDTGKAKDDKTVKVYESASNVFYMT